MRFMLIVKSTASLEAGIAPDERDREAGLLHKQAMAGAGVLLAAEELYPSSCGVRITYASQERRSRGTVSPGPFPADGSLMAEYALIEVASQEEALQWALSIPVPSGSGDYQIELRKLREPEEPLRQPIRSVLEADLQEHLHMFKKRTEGHNSNDEGAV